jgi:hypothetical protein
LPSVVAMACRCRTPPSNRRCGCSGGRSGRGARASISSHRCARRARD